MSGVKTSTRKTMKTNNSNTCIHHEPNAKWWKLRDNDGYLIDIQKTPAKIRHAKRRWFLYLTTTDAERAWAILEGNIEIK